MLRVMAHHAVAVQKPLLPRRVPRGARARRASVAAVHASRGRARRIVLNFQFSSSAALRIMLGSSLWMLGYPDQAPALVESGIALTREAQASSERGVRASRRACSCIAVQPPRRRRGGDGRRAAAPRQAGENFEIWTPFARIFRGWVLVERGESDQGIAEARRGIKMWQDTGSYSKSRRSPMAMLGRSLWKAGRADEALGDARDRAG